MRNPLIALLALQLISACSPRESVDADIRSVETSLSRVVRIAGDSLWTIESRMKNYGVPGVSIAVIKDNKIAWTKGYGVMDTASREPVTPTTLFQAGSISKPVAAYGALKFVQDGKINPDENVNGYLKSWQLADNEFTKDTKVNLKHLLSHTGGVTVHGFLGYSPDLPVPSLVQVLNGESPANSPPIRVDKTPGASYRYSGGGYCIMQQMLIDLDGKTFPEIMQATVLGPLGMTHSTYEQPLPPKKLLLASTGYLPNGRMTKGKRHTYPEMAAAGLWTTSEDLARFAIEIQLSLKGQSNRVLSKEMMTQMATPFVSDRYGLGIGVDSLNGEIYLGHGGWDEGFSSQMTFNRDKGYGVVILTNSNDPPFIDELIRSVAITLGWKGYVREYAPMVMDTNSIKSITGRYGSGSDAVVNIYSKDDRLFYLYSRNAPMELIKVTDSTYVRRERVAQVQFATNPVDGKEHMVFITNPKESKKFEHPKMAEGEKIPYEYFMAGEYEKALQGYLDIQELNPSDGFIQEGGFNNAGYDFLNQGKMKEAKEIFKINIALYPKSSNVYDSYADACTRNGDIDEAIANLRKALSIKPDFAGAKKMLDSLVRTKK